MPVAGAFAVFCSSIDFNETNCSPFKCVFEGIRSDFLPVKAVKFGQIILLTCLYLQKKVHISLIDNYKICESS